jgi:hypothetical protein
MSYKKKGSQQYSQYRVKYRYGGKTHFTSSMTREDAESWAEKWKSIPRPSKWQADAVAQVVSDIEPVHAPTHGYSQQWKVRSETNPNHYYTVSLKTDGIWECSCPHWIYRHRECKHIEQVKDGIRAQAFAPKPREDFFFNEYGEKQLLLPF